VRRVLVVGGLVAATCGLLLAAPRLGGTRAQTTQEAALVNGAISPGTLRPATIDTTDRDQVDLASNARFQEIAVQQQRGRELNHRDTDDLFQALADAHRAP
jgi:hypothetical protein